MIIQENAHLNYYMQCLKSELEFIKKLIDVTQNIEQPYTAYIQLSMKAMLYKMMAGKDISSDKADIEGMLSEAKAKTMGNFVAIDELYSSVKILQSIEWENLEHILGKEKIINEIIGSMI